MSGDRWLVLKGIAGFGDRLMTLSKALQLALYSGRTLLIDWSHDSWNHDTASPKGFFTYFDLSGLYEGVRVVRDDAEIYRILDELTVSAATTTPAAFQGALRRTDWELNRKEGRLYLDGKIAQLNDVEILQSTAPVVVYLAYCSGPLGGILPHLRFKTPYNRDLYHIGVHFRNTDKANSLSACLSRVREVWKTGRRIWLATDDRAAVTAFREEFGDAVSCVEPPARPASGGGIHHCLPDDLAAFGINKEALTHTMIVDLLRLRDSVLFVESMNSLFSQIVWGLRGTRTAGV